MNDQKLRISKIEAARRQLDSAIELWFLDKDEVSVHTLAAAAYQLVHDLKEHKGLARELLYESAMIKDEYRKQWIKVIKKPMNFFKHADNDPEEALEFSPLGSIGFIMGAASGLRFLGEQTSHTMGAFTIWLVVNKPNWITPKFSANSARSALGSTNSRNSNWSPSATFWAFPSRKRCDPRDRYRNVMCPGENLRSGMQSHTLI
jgi:hypothetical protein